MESSLLGSSRTIRTVSSSREVILIDPPVVHPSSTDAAPQSTATVPVLWVDIPRGRMAAVRSMGPLAACWLLCVGSPLVAVGASVATTRTPGTYGAVRVAAVAGFCLGLALLVAVTARAAGGDDGPGTQPAG